MCLPGTLSFVHFSNSETKRFAQNFQQDGERRAFDVIQTQKGKIYSADVEGL
jgi:hypothetical protein